jgi:hypothetical protein
MAVGNHEKIRQALVLLTKGLRPFIEREMLGVYGENWEEEARLVLKMFPDSELHWDSQAVLSLIDRRWNEVFRRKLDRKHRSWVNEAKALRNDLMHEKREVFSEKETIRGLDTIEFLLHAVEAPESQEVSLLKNSVSEKLSSASPSPVVEKSSRVIRIQPNQADTELLRNSTPTKQMNRSNAIALLAQQGSIEVTSSNSHFANINSSKNVWWLDLPISKVSQVSDPHIHLLLYDQQEGTLHHLAIPKSYIKQNQQRLVTRESKGCISLELSADENRKFHDVRPKGCGVEFKQFLKETVATRLDQPAVGAQSSKVKSSAESMRDFKPGDIVFHPLYGRGQIFRTIDSTKLAVKFDSGRVKKFVASLVDLKKADKQRS